MSCSVCNAVRVVEHACSCGTNTCRGCSRRCVMEFTKSCACVGCHRPWSVDEAVRRLGKTFWNTTYRRMRREQLRRVDETLIAESTPEALQIRTERRLTAEMQTLAHDIRNGRVDLIPQYRRLQDSLLRTTSSPSRTLLMRCTESNCPGFLITHPVHTQRRVCQTCTLQTCARCGERIQDGAPDGEHECDENIVASRQTILRECKPCVRCHVPSLRTVGCSTMWCPHCHTFWNWDTERIIETRWSSPHNPDHRAFLINGDQRHPPRVRREVDDVPCGGLPDGIVVHNAFVRDSLAVNHLSVFAPLIIDALECIHMSQRMRHHYPHTWNAHEQFRPVRIAFILGNVTRDNYMMTMERMERTFEFRREVGCVLELFVLAGADIFQRLCAGDDAIVSVCFSLSALREIVDARLAHIGSTFQRKSPRIGRDWKWSGLRRRQ